MITGPFSAAAEFGFPDWESSPDVQPATPLASVEKTASGAWYTHPSVAIFAVVLGGAALLAHTTRPLAGARLSAHAGPAKGSVEGEI